MEGGGGFRVKDEGRWRVKGVEGRRGERWKESGRWKGRREGKGGGRRG